MQLYRLALLSKRFQLPSGCLNRLHLVAVHDPLKTIGL
jgi:hypothetical protein